MENRTEKFRNHISIVIEQSIGGFVAFFVIFGVNVLQDADELTQADLSEIGKAGWLVLLGLLVLIGIVVVNRLLVWARTYICIEENAVVIERNTVNKKKNTISIRNISNINLEQNLFEMLIGTCKVKIDTNSRSTADSTDVKIVLKKADAEWFKQEITRKMMTAAGYPDPYAGDGAYGVPGKAADVRTDAAVSSGTVPAGVSAYEAEDENYDIRADFGDIIQHGIFSINIFSVLVVIGGVAAAVGAVVRLVDDPDLMGSLLSAAAGIIVVVSFVFSAIWDTLKDFIRYYDFRAMRRGDRIHIRYGLLKKMEYTIPVGKIQALKIRQSFIARIFGRYMAEIVNVGMGDEKEEQNSFLVLYCTGNQMKEQLKLLLPEYADALDQETERIPGAAWAAWSFSMAVYTACVCACGAALHLALPEHRILIWCCTAGLLILSLFMLILRYISSGTGIGDLTLKLVHGYFGRNYIIMKYSDIQYVEFEQNFIARACKIRRGSVHLLASNADTSHGIPYFRGDGEDKVRQGMLMGK